MLVLWDVPYINRQFSMEPIFLSEHPAFMGALTRDQQQVRDILSPYDLLIVLGADVLRMSVWAPVEPLPEGMPIVQIGQRG